MTRRSFRNPESECYTHQPPGTPNHCVYNLSDMILDMNLGSCFDIDYYEQDVEEVDAWDNYKYGGFAPIDIGDTINDRYIIVHKLGYGGNAAVWAAMDKKQDLCEYGRQRNFVAIKVMVPNQSGSNEIQILQALNPTNNPDSVFPCMYETFQHKSPNGMHQCYVSNIAGPSVNGLIVESGSGRLPLHVSRKVAYQVGQALAYMHSIGIVHGDFHDGNMVFAIPGLDSWTLDRFYEVFGKPYLIPNQFPPKDFPEYNFPKSFTRCAYNTHIRDLCFKAPSVRIIDFGESFQCPAGSVRRILRTPVNFAPPETLLNTAVGRPVDIWAYASVLFNLFSDHGLWHVDPNPEESDVVLFQYALTCGQFPDDMWQRWRTKEKWFEADGTLTDLARRNLRSDIEATLKGRVSNFLKYRRGGRWVSGVEMDTLVGLLMQMLRVDPNMRLTAEQVLQWLPNEWRYGRAPKVGLQ